ENNKLKYITSNSVKGIGLRVIKEGRIGFTTTTDLRDLERLVGKAVRSAKFGQEAQFEFPCQKAFSEIKIFDKAVVDYPTEDAI
ncbi:MAG: hypothetical protein J3T61_07260, partial [Candidatus Brocadiales bacterium]|nr:hypothetical protein [Candidatus Bathyanammoxibius sp.]